MNEAHVEHAVGFIENENFGVRKIGVALLDQIEQPAWCGDENVHAISQRLHLRMLANAAENDGVPQAGVPAIVSSKALLRSAKPARAS